MKKLRSTILLAISIGVGAVSASEKDDRMSVNSWSTPMEHLLDPMSSTNPWSNDDTLSVWSDLDHNFRMPLLRQDNAFPSTFTNPTGPDSENVSVISSLGPFQTPQSLLNPLPSSTMMEDDNMSTLHFDQDAPLQLAPQVIPPVIDLSSPPPKLLQTPQTLLNPLPSSMMMEDDNMSMLHFDQNAPLRSAPQVLRPVVKINLTKKRPKPSPVFSPNMEQVTFDCPFCGKSFKKKHLLNEHKKRQHPGGRKFTCTYCSRKFSADKSRKTHETKEHQDQIIGIPCPHCKGKFANQHSLICHINTQHPTQKKGDHLCPYCDIHYKSLGGLKKHIKCHKKSEEIRICIYCLKDCKTPTGLKAHVLVHKGEVKKYRCPKCKYTSSKIMNRNKHMKNCCKPSQAGL